MKVTVFTGGVGGAKLVLGLSKVVDATDLTVVVNVGDDDDRHGLIISPDPDIVNYTLAGVVDAEKGWGVEADTFEAVTWLEKLGEDASFALGDKDLAMHILRTDLIRQGKRPTEAAAILTARLGVEINLVLPTDDQVRTRFRREDGWASVAEHYLRDWCKPDVLEVAYEGASEARPTPEVLEAIASADVIIFAPSNPVASLGPILAIPGIREAIQQAAVPVVAISPLVGGSSLKGATDRMMRSLGVASTALGVAEWFGDLLDVLVIDTVDADLESAIAEQGIRVVVADTIMEETSDKAWLAQVAIAAATGEPLPERQETPITAKEISKVGVVVPFLMTSDIGSSLCESLSAEDAIGLRNTLFQASMDVVRQLLTEADLLVVTDDPSVADSVEQKEDHVLRLETGVALEEGIRQGTDWIAEKGYARQLLLPPNLWMVSVTELDALLALRLRAPAVVGVPCDEDNEVHAVVTTPPNAIPLQLGTGSFAGIAQAAEQEGVVSEVVRLPGLGTVISTAEDLLGWAKNHPDSPVGRWVVEVGLKKKLASSKSERSWLFGFGRSSTPKSVT